MDKAIKTQKGTKKDRVTDAVCPLSFCKRSQSNGGGQDNRIDRIKEKREKRLPGRLRCSAQERRRATWGAEACCAERYAAAPRNPPTDSPEESCLKCDSHPQEGGIRVDVAERGFYNL